MATRHDRSWPPAVSTYGRGDAGPRPDRPPGRALSGLATVATWLLLTVLGVPYALSLGLLVGFFDLISLVGATLGASTDITSRQIEDDARAEIASDPRIGSARRPQCEGRPRQSNAAIGARLFISASERFFDLGDSPGYRSRTAHDS
jgi:hypothetical protein